MNLKDHFSKFQAKADEGICLGYSQDPVTYRVMNKRTRRTKEAFNLIFDDYFVKRVETIFPQNPIFSNSQDDYDQSLLLI